jgi:chromosome partitioning protein
MAGVIESCSICKGEFEVQFRYQMEERDGGFAFYCSQECHGRAVRGEDSGGVTCDGCSKRFQVELVSQVVRVKGTRRYACSDACRTQLLAEGDGARLGAFSAPAVIPASEVPPAPASAPGRSPTASSVARPPVVTAMPAAPPSALSTHASEKRVEPRERMPIDGPRRLAIFNHKGGTGKTTTSVSVAAGLAARGARVLLVDTDSQGNVSVSLGVKAERSLYHVLVMGLRASDAVVPVRPNLDLIVSNETLAAAELYLAGRQNRDRILSTRLAPLFDAYDVVVLDCSPSLSLMNQNALVCADGVLVPVACDFLSLVGVRQVIKTIKNVNTLLHHPVQIYGVLPTFYDGRARICRDAVATLKEHFGDRCLPPIRAAMKIKEAPAQAKTIFEYDGGSNAALDYMKTVDRIVYGREAPEGSVTEEAESRDSRRAVSA